jgi:hypothetical protein
MIEFSPEADVPLAVARSPMLTLLAAAIWQAVSPDLTVYVPLALAELAVLELLLEGVLVLLGAPLLDEPLAADAGVEEVDAEVEVDAVGIFSTVPIGTELGSLMLLAATRAAVVRPRELAMSEIVSPALTV